MSGLKRHRDLSETGSLVGNFIPEAGGHYGRYAASVAAPVAASFVAARNPVIEALNVDRGFEQHHEV